MVNKVLLFYFAFLFFVNLFMTCFTNGFITLSNNGVEAATVAITTVLTTALAVGMY